MAADSISLLEVNALNNEIFLAINRIRHLWKRYQSITKYFLQEHISKFIIGEKIINKIKKLL